MEPSSSTPSIGVQAFSELLDGVHHLTGLAAAGEVERLFHLVTESHPLADRPPTGDLPVTLEPTWNKLGSGLWESAWAALGYVLARERLEEMTVLAQRALAHFDVEPSQDALDAIVAAVPAEVAHIEKRLPAWVQANASHLEADPLGRWMLSECRPVGTAGLLSYAVARAATPVVMRGVHPSKEFVRGALGPARWRVLEAAAESKNLADDWATMHLDLPDGPVARALVVAGIRGPLPGVPETLNGPAFIEGLQRTILNDKRLCLAPPF